MIYAGSGRDFEFITEVNGTPRNEAADKLGGIPADSPLDYYVRLISDGENLTAAYSYNGNTFTHRRPSGLAGDVRRPEDRPGGAVRRGSDRPGGALRLDPLRPGRLGWRRLRGHRRQLRRHRARRRLVAGPPDPGRGRRQRHPADPGSPGRHLPDPQRRSGPDRPRRARPVLGRPSRRSTSKAPPSTSRPGSWSTATTTTSSKFGRIAHSAAGDEKFEFINEVNAVARNEAADSTANIPATFPNDYWLRLTSDGTNVVGPLLDRRDHVDPGRASGGAAGERQDRPVRVLQRRGGQPGRGLRLVHPHG